MTFAENLKYIRLKKNIKQCDFAKMVGMSPSSYRKYESGTQAPSAKMIKRFADALGVEAATLRQSNLDEVSATIELFKIAKEYDGSIYTGTELVDAVSNNTIDKNAYYICLPKPQKYLEIWHSASKKYSENISIANQIEDLTLRETLIDRFSEEYTDFMNNFPNSITLFSEDIKKIHEFMSLHPLNDPNKPLSSSEKNKLINELKNLIDSL